MPLDMAMLDYHWRESGIDLDSAGGSGPELES